MKIGFVNQPFDTIIPPGQNSVGYYTYGVACELAKSCKVIVYGLQANHSGSRAGSANQNIDFRLLPSTRTPTGYVLELAQSLGSYSILRGPYRLPNCCSPAYGRQVAIDLHEEQCDVIHIQHCSQYAPIIRAKNPTAQIVLHIHAEWFSQSNLEVLRRRLEGVDSLLTVSDHIARKCRREFPTIVDRCEMRTAALTPRSFPRSRTIPRPPNEGRKGFYTPAPFRRKRASTC